MVRVGVIGTGFGGRVVAPSFAATEGVEVVEVVSPRDEAAVAALVARADVDLVSVHSPPFLHRRHVELALAAGRHVLCDKPFGLGVTDAAAMVEAAEAAGVVALCNFEFRYHPGRVALRSLVADGTLGALQQISWFHHLNGSRDPLRAFGWLFDAAAGGGWIGAWASHVVDGVRWLTGEEIAEVSGRRLLGVGDRPDRDGVVQRCTAEDGCVVALTTVTGVTVAVDSSFVAAASLPSRVVLSGAAAVVESVADATITIRHARRTAGFPSAGGKEVREVAPVPGDPHLGPMLTMAGIVRDAVRAGAAPPGAPTFVDGLACARVLDRLRALPLTISPG
jgi:predicted dehydrogenase